VSSDCATRRAGLVAHERSLANLAKRNLSQLTRPGEDPGLRRMQYWPALLEGFLASTGLDLTPFSNRTIRDL
jgi:hypothetical protein